ncbi:MULTISPECIES: AIR synthase [unclassified Prochlorococcus]|uniref:AIR synthase n=1 Tax=unclassified Prochlorococcus TaxID=2627481 RepID=UPI000533A7B5|nr:MULTISPECIES: AIR synthase [unclassified Prochlorococcus]KGG14537.1 putative AIR synthase related protein [Prochlorococcus sp. MIT 0602]KGG16038.1 putative AIR synthase related protein [Prochlorococcus sp. MIT 0603]
MLKTFGLTITATAAAELVRQSTFAGSPGLMHIDLLPDSFGEGWLYIRLRSGHQSGVPIARTDGITLYAPSDQLSLLEGLKLDYFGDLTGGGFLISTPKGAQASGCGTGFKLNLDK